MSSDIKIGIVQHPHEIDIELETGADELIAKIDSAIEQDKPLIWVTDSKGNRYGVPVSKLAFVEVRNGDDSKRVGFGV